MPAALSGDSLLVGASGYDHDRGLVYPFERTSAGWVSQPSVSRAEFQQGDLFGGALAIDGDTAIIASPEVNQQKGAAFIYQRVNGQWQPGPELVGSDVVAGDGFGNAVAISGDTAIVGAPTKGTGAAYIFVRAGDAWTQQRKVASPASSQAFGVAVALDGDTALVGDKGTDHAKGLVWVLVRAKAKWSVQQRIQPDGIQAKDMFGGAVSISGDTAIASSVLFSDLERGAAYVFTRSAGVWTQQQRLIPSDDGQNHVFGWTVCVRGDRALVTAPNEALGEERPGAAYLFTRYAGVWTEQQKLTPDVLPEPAIQDSGFGTAVALGPHTAVVTRAAPLGLVYVFEEAETGGAPGAPSGGVGGAPFGEAGNPPCELGGIGNDSPTEQAGAGSAPPVDLVEGGRGGAASDSSEAIPPARNDGGAGQADSTGVAAGAPPATTGASGSSSSGCALRPAASFPSRAGHEGELLVVAVGLVLVRGRGRRPWLRLRARARR
ncbi:MAG: hypothetical protein ABUL60_23225 [Myxococcales bacterium]